VTETELMEHGRTAFQNRVRSLNIKPTTKKYQDEMMAFAEGFLEAGIRCGTLSQDTRGRAVFLAMTGRLDAWFGPKPA
jgi:hypothetical protein